MNKQRRSQITKIIERLEAINEDIDNILCEEQESYDNLPESLQESSRGEAMTEAIEALESSYSSVEEAIDYLNEIDGV